MARAHGGRSRTLEERADASSLLALCLWSLAAASTASAVALPPARSRPRASVAAALPMATRYRYDSPFLPDDPGGPAALVLLNTPVAAGGDDGRLTGVLGRLWAASTYRVCADGGANRLYDATRALQTPGNLSASNLHATDRLPDLTASVPVHGRGRRGVAAWAAQSRRVSNSRLADALVEADYLPDLITGDLDSLRPDVRHFYEGRGTNVLRVEDQDRHDLDKALMAVEKWAERTRQEDAAAGVRLRTFIYGGFGGRFDHVMACINTLYVWGQKEGFRDHSLALYDEETCAFVLPAASSPARSEVRLRFTGEAAAGKEGDDQDDWEEVDEGVREQADVAGSIEEREEEEAESVRSDETEESFEGMLAGLASDASGSREEDASERSSDAEDGGRPRAGEASDAGSDAEDEDEDAVGEGPTCGLVPLGGRCDRATTSGLRWDLDGARPLEFGGLVSTSNRAAAPIVTVEASAPLLFTAEMRGGVVPGATPRQKEGRRAGWRRTAMRRGRSVKLDAGFKF